MKVLFLGLISFLFMQHSIAQPCNYTKLVDEAQLFFDSSKFKEAFNKLNSAKACNPDSAKKVDKKIEDWFSEINGQKLALDRIKKQRDIDNRKLLEMNRKYIRANDSLKIANNKLDTANKKIGSLEDLIASSKKNTGIIKSTTSTDSIKYQKNPTIDTSNKKINSFQNSDIGLKGNYLALKKEIDGYSAAESLPDDLQYNFIMATFLYAHDLMNKNQRDAAKHILLSTADIVKKLAVTSAPLFFAHGRLENALARSGIFSDKDVLTHRSNAVSFYRQAIKFDSSNLEYKRALIVELNNLTFTSDSLLSAEEKNNFFREANELTYLIENRPGVDTIALDQVLEFRYRDAVRMIDNKDYDDAEKILDTYIKRLDSLTPANPKTKDLYLYKARLLVLQAKIASKKSDLLLRDSLIFKALDSWLVVFEGKLENIINPYLVKDVYNEMKAAINKYFTTEKENEDKFYQRLTDRVRTAGRTAMDLPDVFAIMKEGYAKLYSFLPDNTSRVVIEKKQGILTKTIELFDAATDLSNLSVFSEDYNDYAGEYLKLMDIYNNTEYLQPSINTLKKMDSLFTPVLNRYPFDFYLRDKMIFAKLDAGLLMANDINKMYKEAKPLLEYASKWGIKQASLKLSDLYKEGKFDSVDMQKAINYEELANRQVTKRFSIDCSFGSEIIPFDFYVRELPKDNTAYRGIDDQAAWLKAARGGIVPEKVTQSFIKLQQLAWDNNISFPNLCDIGTDALKEEEILSKYRPYKKQIESENDLTIKKKLYNNLYNLYKVDMLKKSSERSDKKIISKDAISFYLGYAKFLRENNDESGAKTMYSNVTALDKENSEAREGLLRFDYKKNKINLPLLTQAKTPAELLIIMGFYLEEKNKKSGATIMNQILRIKPDDIAVRDSINQIYLSKTGEDIFASLFLTNRQKIKAYREYFTNKDVISFPTNELKRLHYYNLITLDKEYYKQHSGIDTKKEIAQHYNSLAWYSLLTKNFENVETYCYESLRFDSTYKYPLTNLPHYYLRSGQFEKAEKMYRDLMTQEFDKDGGYPTFRDAFLSDFFDFEKAGIKMNGMDAIKKLLTDK